MDCCLQIKDKLLNIWEKMPNKIQGVIITSLLTVSSNYMHYKKWGEITAKQTGKWSNKGSKYPPPTVMYETRFLRIAAKPADTNR